MTKKQQQTILSIVAAAFAIVFVSLAVAPRYRADWLLENWLVFALLAYLIRGYRRAPLSTSSYAAIFGFLILHEIGAHFTYSEVPYDLWFESAFGTSLNGLCGWDRNHFDRLVHFSYGLLLSYPVLELLVRHTGARGFVAYFVAMNLTLAGSAWYELIEWAAATTFGGDLGMAYLGTQGDVWDAHWDMGLAAVGAVLGLAFTAACRQWPRTKADDSSGIEAIARTLGRTDARAFGDPSPAGVEWIQTHISHVFLTPGRAFKLRKSVRFDFLDFSSRDRRNADCLREVQLNRRLAPQVYLGVAPIEASPSGLRIGALRAHCAAADLDSTHEHVVVMERLPPGRDAKALVASGEFGAAHIQSIVAALVRFHDAHGLPDQASGQGLSRVRDWRAGIERTMLSNFASMHEATLGPQWLGLVDEVREGTVRALGSLGAVLERRYTDGRIVDGHGDLHLQHIWFAPDSLEPIFVDCLEFNDSLRLIDRASEMGFLAMDLACCGRRDLGERLLEQYAVASDDFHLYSVVDFYAAYRASVRAKVSALATLENEIPHAQRKAAAESAIRYLELAAGYLAARPVGTVVCMTGTVGSGKSTCARRLADRVGGVIVSTDTTRRKTVGLPDAAHLYAPERRFAVYEQVLERASWPARSGRTVVIDATFETAALRGLAWQWAGSIDARVLLVRTRVSEATARDRLVAREHSGVGDSDAGPSQLEASLARYEEPDEWPSDRRFAVDTESPDYDSGLDAIVAEAAGTAGNPQPFLEEM